MACIGDVTLFKGSWADVALEEVPVPLEDYVLQNEALLDELQEAVEVPFEATRTSFTLGGSATKKAPRRRGGTFVAMEPEKNKRASGLSRAEKRWRNKVNKERAKAAKHRRAAPCSAAPGGVATSKCQSSEPTWPCVSFNGQSSFCLKDAGTGKPPSAKPGAASAPTAPLFAFSNLDRGQERRFMNRRARQGGSTRRLVVGAASRCTVLTTVD